MKRPEGPIVVFGVVEHDRYFAVNADIGGVHYQARHLQSNGAWVLLRWVGYFFGDDMFEMVNQPWSLDVALDIHAEYLKSPFSRG